MSAAGVVDAPPSDRGLRLQAAGTSMVVLGSAYASYRHGQAFALRFGADQATASIWPLIVDGLMTIATVELWKPEPVSELRSDRLDGLEDGPSHQARKYGGSAGRWFAWLSLVFGVGLSLCANLASAPMAGPFAFAVAGSPPVALLLSVEMLNRALKRHRADRVSGLPELDDRIALNDGLVAVDVEPLNGLANARDGTSAERRMWDYYCRAREHGHRPTGAELDRAVGTNNYGRRVLRRWRQDGLLESCD